MKSEDYVGQRHGQLTIIAFDGIRSFAGGRATYFTFLCDCGVKFSAQKSNVIGKRDRCKSCRGAKFMSAPDGATSHPLYKRWYHMINRCTNKANKSYADYGARGISVCDRWLSGSDGLTGFECFVYDMGPWPKGYTIERKNVNEGYDPKNCCWLPKSGQSANRRNVEQIEIDGVYATLPVWCERFGVKYWTARARLKRGLPLHEVFEPVP